jgi:hypothetical protein
MIKITKAPSYAHECTSCGKKTIHLVDLRVGNGGGMLVAMLCPRCIDKLHGEITLLENTAPADYVELEPMDPADAFHDIATKSNALLDKIDMKIDELNSAVNKIGGDAQ